MGNVLAASAPPLSKPLDAKSLGIPEPAASSLPAVNEKTKLENPGTVEELHKKCKDVQATPFEGAKVMLNQCLSHHFQVSHSLNMASTQPSGYRFGATYVGTKQFSPTDVYPVLLGDIDPAGNMNSTIIHQFTSRIRCKLLSQFQDSKMAVAQLTTEYRGDEYTASATLGNPNLLNNSGVFVGNYLQAVTPTIAAGAEIAYQWGSNIPGGQMAIVTAVGRYTKDNYIWSGSLSPFGVHLCYYQKCSEQIQVGVEVESSLRMQESTATLSYQADLPKADLVFRGTFDSNWNVCGFFEKRLNPLPFSFILSGRLNHTKNQFRLGCGMIIG